MNVVLKYNLVFKKITGILLCSLLLLTITSCDKKSGSTKNLVFELSCDATHLDSTEKPNPHMHKVTNEREVPVYLGGTLTNKEYFSAPASILLTDKRRFGFSTNVDIVRDQFFEVTVWKKSKPNAVALVASGKNSRTFFMTSKKVVETREDGWEKLKLKISAPPANDMIVIYALLLVGHDSAYVDDISIKVVQEREYPTYTNNDKLHLYFSDKKMEAFEDEREESFKTGVHFSADDWNKGVFSTGEDVLPIKARLKGDWLDHMQGKKWSFRVKVRKGKVFNRMRTFSLQTPKSRYFLHEFLSHQLFLSEGLLTPRYSFSPVYINSKSRGIYAIEEHFAKQLIEYNLRREGPILKFDENPRWRNVAFMYSKMGRNSVMPEYDVSRILPFGLNKTLSSEKLRKQFSVAEGLLYQYKYRKAPIDELFDVDKLARFLALFDLVDGKHGKAWHNQRYYYNPVICKIELINYDNFTDHHDTERAPKLEAFEFDQKREALPSENLYASYFTSKKLVDRYIQYLEKFTTDDYVLDFYNTQKDTIAKFLPLIKEEFPFYTIDSTYLLQKARAIRELIPDLKQKRDEGYFEGIEIKDDKFSLNDLYKPSVIPYYVNAFYFQNNASGTSSLEIENFNNNKIQLTSLEDENGRTLYRFNKEIVVNRYKNSIHGDTTLTLPYFELATHIVYKDLDSNKQYKSELSLWQRNTSESPYQRLLKSDSSNPAQLFTIKGDSLILQKGNYSLSNKILIPHGKTVIVEPGVTVDLIKQAAIISHSAFQFKGTEKDSIIFTSTDYTSNGIVALQAGEKSKLSYTRFTNLNTLDYLNWTLSGAVNFYESDVSISNCVFQSNLCEDALNIVRCNFKVSNCKFLDIYADAFDSDFCTGVLEGSTFDRVGNDAIDFSTSQIEIKDCEIANISDKGISGGEGSTLSVLNTNIEKCNIGAASKDLSLVELKNVSISDCKYGLVLLKKKPEYGPAKIISEELKLNNCETDHLIEKKSTVLLNGEKIEGTKKNVSKMFY